MTWFETLAAYIRVKHGLGEALHNAAVRNAIDETYAPVVAAVARLLDACAADGSVRPGLDPADVLLVMGFLWRVARTTMASSKAAGWCRSSSTASAATPNAERAFGPARRRVAGLPKAQPRPGFFSSFRGRQLGVERREGL